MWRSQQKPANRGRLVGADRVELGATLSVVFVNAARARHIFGTLKDEKDL